MSSKIVVVGSLNMDMVVHSDKLPSLGETVLGGEFMMVPGGKGANQAVAAARLGGSVSMIGCVGNDIFGKELLRNLTQNRVDVTHVQILDDVSTGVALITVKKGNNAIVVAPEANSRLLPDKIDDAEELIRQASVLVVQLEIPQQTVLRAMEIAHKNQVKVLLNPAPAVSLSEEHLSLVDILTPNENECEIITGMRIRSVEEAKSAVTLLNRKGVKTAIVTLGSNGVVYNVGNEVFHLPAHRVPVVDTTAAGDSFSGALACALSEGSDLHNAVKFANGVGALTVTRRGAQTSLPFLHEVQSFLQATAAQDQ